MLLIRNQMNCKDGKNTNLNKDPVRPMAAKKKIKKKSHIFVNYKR